jgi:enoyl-CoA hydratase/carnithine racemase
MMIFGKKYAAKEALKLRLVDIITAENQVLAKSIEVAESLASKGDDKVTMKMIKNEMYKNTMNALVNGGLGESEKSLSNLLKASM